MESNNMSAGGKPMTSMAVPPIEINLVRMRTSEGVSITCHENESPPFVETELERLYGALFSSLARYRIYGGVENASTCVVREGSAITSIWLFRRKGRVVQVINEGIVIGAEDIRRFADYIFAVYGSVDVISFHAVETKFQGLTYPYQRCNCLEDIVLTLPHSIEEYRSSLGKATRTYIDRYLKGLQRNFPSYRYQVCARQEIGEQLIRDIVLLNRHRMANKGKVSSLDEEETQRLTQLARECGLVCFITIDGRVRAGTINFAIGHNCFLEVVAHDPEYNDFRLGTLCCYLTVCECINRGNAEYHFLWGRNEYKYRLRGVQRDLYDVAVYRSPARFLLSAKTATKLVINGRIHGAKAWLLDKAREKSGFTSRLAFHLLSSLRSLKHFASMSLVRSK